MTAQGLLDGTRDPGKGDLDIQVAGSRHGAVNDRRRCMVAAHGIYGQANHW
jgi:hypothetical protein